MSALLGPTVMAPPVRFDRPYKGLDPYSESEADALLFFGREAERKIVTSNLIGSKLTLLYGPSGVGKSSLLRAGVTFHLRRAAEADSTERENPEFAVVVFRSWAGDPLDAILDAVAQTVEGGVGVADRYSPPEGATLAEALEAWSDRFGGELLIVLDQFEEYFLYHGDEEGEGTFAVEFPAAVNGVGLHANFLISIREDALAKLDRFKGRIPGLFDNYLRLDHLDRAAARLAIEKPLERYSAAAEAVDIETELVDAVLDQVRFGRVAFGSAGRGGIDVGPGSAVTDDRVETLYLQMVMSRLWVEERGSGSTTLRLQTLEALGGAVEIVRTHLADALETLSEREREVTARAFTYLVTPAGAKIALTVAELADGTRLPTEELEPVLQRLRELHILGIEQSTEARYEISHDALAKVILEWRGRHKEERERAEAARRRQEALELQQRRERVRLFAGLLLMLLLAVVLTATAAIIAFQQRGKAQEREQDALSQGLARKSALDLQSDPALGLSQAIRAVDIAPTDEAREAVRLALAQHRLQAILRQPELVVRTAAFSTDGRSVLTSGENGTALWAATGRGPNVLEKAGSVAAFSPDGRLIASGSDEGRVRVVEATRPRRELLAVRQPSQVVSVALGSAGNRLVTGGSDGVTRIWDVATRRLLHALRGSADPVPVLNAALSPDGRFVLAVSADGDARVWSARTGELVALLGRQNVLSASFSPDGTRVVTADVDGLAQIRRTSDGSVLRELGGQAAQITSAAFSSDGARLLTGSRDSTATLWTSATGRPLAILTGHAKSVTGVGFSPSGRLLVTASRDGTARVWGAQDGKIRAVLVGESGDEVAGAAFSADNRSLVTISNDGSARLWRAPIGQGETVFEATSRRIGGATGSAQPRGISAARFTRDGRRIVVATGDGRIQVRDAATRRVVAGAEGDRLLTGAPALSLDGRLAATASEEGETRIWRLDSARVPAVLKGQEGQVTSAAFSPDGKLLVTANTGGIARIWDVAGERRPQRLSGHRGPINTVSFSPDGARIVTASTDATARVWDTATGKGVGTLRGHAAPVVTAAFSPDGTLVATAGDDGTVRVWNLSAEEPTGTILRGHTETVTSISFSSNGRLLSSSSVDGTARVWNLDDRQAVLLAGHTNRVATIAFSPDDDIVVTASADGTARIWDVFTGRTVAILEGHAGGVNAAGFSPDGASILTAGEDGTTRLYACEVCGSFESVLRLARASVERDTPRPKTR